LREKLLDPLQIKNQIWRELGRSTKDRHHSWRTPVFASLGLDGQVNARTVVLRNVDHNAGKLQIFSDSRSHKLAEISKNQQAFFIFWCSRLSWQLRILVNATLSFDRAELDRVWQAIKVTSSASDYLQPISPGSVVSSPDQLNIDSLTEHPYFSIINSKVIDIDWLELSRTGHRRAKITLESWDWLAP